MLLLPPVYSQMLVLWSRHSLRGGHHCRYIRTIQRTEVSILWITNNENCLMASPAAYRLLLVINNPRVEKGIEEIGDQIGEHDQSSTNHSRSQDHGVVKVHQGIDSKAAVTRNTEDLIEE